MASHIFSNQTKQTNNVVFSYDYAKIYQGMIGDEEVKTGEKLKVDRNLSEEQAMANPKVATQNNDNNT